MTTTVVELDPTSVSELSSETKTRAVSGDRIVSAYYRYDFSNICENQLSRLQPHPLNEKVYGASKPDKGLLESVAKHGVFNPIVINRNKEILSGTRRWLAGKSGRSRKNSSSDATIREERFCF